MVASSTAAPSRRLSIHTSSAARTFWFDFSRVNDGTGGRVSNIASIVDPDSALVCKRDGLQFWAIAYSTVDRSGEFPQNGHMTGTGPGRYSGRMKARPFEAARQRALTLQAAAPRCHRHHAFRNS